MSSTRPLAADCPHHLLLEADVLVNRVSNAMQSDDLALVFRLLTCLLQEGVVLDAAAMRGIPWNLGLLTYLEN